MKRTVAAAASAAALALVAASPLAAQELFWDGFDQGDLCAWSNPPATIQESEAYNQSGTNDDAVDAELIGRCAVVEGTIGDPYDADPSAVEDIRADTDWFEIDVDGPVILRIELERLGEASLFEPVAYLLNSSNSFPDFGLTTPGEPLLDPITTVRQIYLPENGFDFLDPSPFAKSIPNLNKWLLNIDDQRNGGPGGPFGDQDDRYRLTLTIDPVAGPSALSSNSPEQVETPADGSLLIYRIDGATVETLDLGETFIDRSDPGRLDTKLYVVRKSGNALATVAGSDDFDSTGSHRDSKLQSVPLTADPHFVIVDSYARYETGAIAFDLTISFLQPLWD